MRPPVERAECVGPGPGADRFEEEGRLMTGVIVCADGVARCPWGAGDAVNMTYHDTEWGCPVRGESAHFERLTLEAFQSGLSWRTILNKRPAFREVFAGFDTDVVAGFDDADTARLLADQRIVRNRMKIVAAVSNARATVELRAAGGLEHLIWSFRPESVSAPENTDHVPSATAESEALSAALKRRGFVFVGPTTMYALMQAIGLVDDHLAGCFRRGVATDSASGERIS
ncbi:MAG: DNA-3-methyladenine glycosylase I [Nocardioides sp.]